MRHLLEDRVAVLLDELLRGVGHRRDKVGEREVVARVEACAPLLVELGELGGADGVLLVEEGAESRVLAAVAEPALLVQQGEHSVRQVLDGGHDRAVVGHLDGRPLDLLRLVVRLLVVEDGVEEEALQLLVGQVDEQLLERVGAEDLEAEDVEEADRAPIGGRDATGAERLVEPLDHVVKDGRVDRPRHGVARVAALLGREGERVGRSLPREALGEDGRAVDLEDLSRQLGLELLLLHAEQVRHHGERRSVRNLARVVLLVRARVGHLGRVRLGEAHVAEGEHGGEQLEEGSLLRLVEAGELQPRGQLLPAGGVVDARSLGLAVAEVGVIGG
mmetsp:Transcript_39366/g.130310  ORF Transcript_39366/g.130310 Transcript_39366/m.130310 type:complete len:332 (-) Transcript_39366:717-1712(-)